MPEDVTKADRSLPHGGGIYLKQWRCGQSSPSFLSHIADSCPLLRLHSSPHFIPHPTLFLGVVSHAMADQLEKRKKKLKRNNAFGEGLMHKGDGRILGIREAEKRRKKSEVPRKADSTRNTPSHTLPPKGNCTGKTSRETHGLSHQSNAQQVPQLTNS